MNRKAILVISIVLPISFLLVVYFFVWKFSNHYFRSPENEEIRVEGGTFSRINPQTGQTESITIKSFYLDKNLTTVAEFDEFVKDTKYVTEADKFGNSAVFENGAWILKEGANYWYPFGKDKPKAELSHPVTQVSWNDAIAYAKWKGKRLPTEAEWEYAATNRGKSNAKFPWGDNLIVKGKYLANTWQGPFPSENTKLDGYEFTSPVGAFPASELGFNDIGGNVWQWCSDTIQPTQQEAYQDPSLRRPSKGASFLTDVSTNPDATIWGRSSSTPETGISHTGFRLAKDVK